METAPNFDYFEDRYPKRIRKPINKPDVLDDLEDELLFQKQKLMSHCVYDIQEIVASEEFKDDLVVKMTDASGFNAEYIKQFGLSTPMLFLVPPTELSMIVPDSESFTVYDVLDLAGKDRKIEVVEVNEQKGRTMKLADFVKYYTCAPEFRHELLNVLSLEFSMTNLANMVKPPGFVQQIDWIDNIWPRELIERQKIHMKTNRFSDFSTYPKVQRYCLMSVANCFTDFHIDFGGTSVWYHVLKGRKIFWLIEPTEENLLLYEEWIRGGNNSESFFGRIVNKCNRVELFPGMTFIIPSGWIHCVFTPEDSLVFGGNFLHSYSIPMQIRVVRSEDKIRVGGKYRFPHFKQMMWYVIESVVRKATGRIYLKPIKPKAYLADLHHFDVEEVIVQEAGEDEDLTDDQEPCCSSAIEAGCKKSGLQKAETLLTGMGMEDSESDNEDDPRACEPDDPNICYDDIPNGADNCYILVPTQMKYGAANNEKFMPVTEYNKEYLASLSSAEINGFFALLDYAKKLIKTKKPEVGEGITRPKHLLLEFDYLLTHISNSGKFEVVKDFELFGKATQQENCHQTRELLVPTRIFDSVSANFKQSTKRKKRKLIKNKDEKNPIKAGKITKRINEGVLVDGLPHPIQSENVAIPNPYDFNPLDMIVPLGQKPLPSAYRRSGNLAQLPPTQPTQKFRLKKREDGSNGGSQSLNKPAEEIASPTSFRSESSSSIVQHHQLYNTNLDLAYKSPLQRQAEEKQRRLQEEKERRMQEERERGLREERQRQLRKISMEEEQQRRNRRDEQQRRREDDHNCQRRRYSDEKPPSRQDEDSDRRSDRNRHYSNEHDRHINNKWREDSHHDERAGNYDSNRRDYAERNRGFSGSARVSTSERDDGRTSRGDDYQARVGAYAERAETHMERGGNYSRDAFQPQQANSRNRGFPHNRYQNNKDNDNNKNNGRNNFYANNNNNNNNNGNFRGRGGRWNGGQRGSYRGRFGPIYGFNAQRLPHQANYYQTCFSQQYPMVPPPPPSQWGGIVPGMMPPVPTTGYANHWPMMPPYQQAMMMMPPLIGKPLEVGAQSSSISQRVAQQSSTQPNSLDNIPMPSNAPTQPTTQTTKLSPQMTTVDGFDGIDEIGRLTKLMGNEDTEEDVDLRNSSFFSNADSDVHSETSGGYAIDEEIDNNHPSVSSGDPNTDIDEIYRLTQMYKS